MSLPGGRVTAARLAPIAVGAVVGAVILALATAQPAGVFWDDGVYMITARALAAGEGYRFVHLPDAPAAVHFPPGWPMVLAVVWAAVPDFPANLAVFRLINPVLAAVAAALVFAYGVRRLALAPAVAALAVVIFAVTLPVMILDTVLFAEPAFLVLATCALMAADRAVDGGGHKAAVVAGLAAGAAVLVRSTGLVLVPALCMALLGARRHREALTALVAALALVLPWQLWSAAAGVQLAAPFRGSYGPYLPWLADAVVERGPRFLVETARQNLIAMQRALALVFFPVGLREIRPLLVTLTVLASGLGLVAAWRRARTLALFLVFYAVVVLGWPYAPDRFAWAVWPIAGLILAAGASSAWRFARHPASPTGTRVAAFVVVATVCVAGAGAAFYTARGVSRGWVDVAQRRNAARLEPVVDWVRANTPADAVVACDGEPFVHLYTGRRVVPVHILSPDEYLAGTPLDQAAADLRALISAGRADFAVLSAGASQIEAAAQIGAGTGFPHLVPLDTLPGGGVAFRVKWQH